MNQPPASRLRLQVLIFTATRLVIYTAYRMVYPFLPAIARGLGVELETVALAVTARSTVGLAGPLLGATADVRGRKSALLLGLGLFVGGMLLVALWPGYTSLFAGLMISAAGTIIYDSAMQAYIGDNVDYSHRGLAIAATEFGWSGAFLLGAPVVGWLIVRAGVWSAPFPWLAGLGLAAAVAVWRAVPSDSGTPSSGPRPSLVRGLRLIVAHTPAVAALIFSALLLTGNYVLTIVYADWLETVFALHEAGLGAASSVIGLAGLAGVALVAALADRLGKRRAVSLGIAFNVLACLALPFTEQSLQGALASLFVLFLSFELSLVSAISLMTELVPEARATLLASNVAALMVGEALGALIGPRLFGWGILANCAAAISFDLLALGVLWAFVKLE